LALLQRHDRPTGIECYSDQLAVMLLETIRQLSMTVPDDISMVSFDDSSLVTTTETKLTTVSHPKMKMGEDATDGSGFLNIIGPSLYMRSKAELAQSLYIYGIGV
jgi:GntR family transcriptional regulator of arabinose operon